MIRIAFVIDKIGGNEGGTETQLLMLMAGLDPDRFRPHLIYLRNSPYLAHGVFPFPTTQIHVEKILAPGMVRGMAAFRDLHHKVGFEIVQTTFWDSTVFGTMASRFAGVPIVVSARRSLGYWRTRTRTAMMRVLRGHIDHYVTNSDPVKEEIVSLDGVPADRITVIPNGIDLGLFRPDGKGSRAAKRREWGFVEDDLVIGGVSTLRPVKKVDTLVHAAVTLLKDFPALRFVWLGSGAVEQHRQLAASLGLEKRFVFPGSTREVPEALSALDIAVQCSASESLSNSLLEYMAAGRPIVASDVGGTGHAILDGQTGLLYDPDDPNALTESLRRVILDAELRRVLGDSARGFVHSHYSREAMIRGHAELYTRLHAGTRGGGRT